MAAMIPTCPKVCPKKVLPCPIAHALTQSGVQRTGRLGRNPPGHWLTTIADAPRPGPLRPEIEALAAEVLRDEPEPREPEAGARALRAGAG